MPACITYLLKRGKNAMVCYILFPYQCNTPNNKEKIHILKSNIHEKKKNYCTIADFYVYELHKCCSFTTAERETQR